MTRQIRSWFFRIAGLFDKARRDREMADELDNHLQFHIDEKIRVGMAPDAARRDALIKLGGIEQTKERYRDRRSLPGLESLLQDLRYAGRILRRSPGFTLIALASLGLGIGVNGAIFTVANAALWRPLPVADPQSLVLLSAVRQDGSNTIILSTELADALCRDSDVFSSVITNNDDGLSFSIDGSRAERIVGEVVSPNYFEFLGIQQFIGSGFSPEVRSGQWAAEAVLSYNFWKRRFGGDPAVLGRTIRLNDYPFRIVGVSQPGFLGTVAGRDPELRLPLMPPGQELSQMELASTRTAQITTRLNPGVSVAQAEANAEVVFQQFLQDNPRDEHRANPLRRIRLGPGAEGWQQFVREFRQPLFVLLGLAGLVLLIGCANLANMLLSRASTRGRELAVRAAIGAGRARLVQQMLVEGLGLAALGGGLGVAIAAWGSKALFRFLPQGHIALALNLDTGLRVATFMAALALLTGIVLGLVPGLKATRYDLALSLRSDSSGSIGDAGGAALRKSLVTGEVALSLLLLVVAGLFARSLGKLRSGEQFPAPERLLLFTMKPQKELYNVARMRALTAEVIRRMSSLPGVQAAALAENGPLGSRSDTRAVQAMNGESIKAAADQVSAGYFDAIGLSILAGRDFSPALDRDNSPPVAIVDEMLVRQLFKGENPLGQKIVVGNPGYQAQREIVGVVQASHYYDLHRTAAPAVFTNIQQDPAYMPTLHLRFAAGNAAAMVAGVRREFDAIDKEFPIFNIRTLEDRVDDSLASERLVSQLAAGFGSLALLLALIGIYGVMSYSVAQRSREIGVRMALGAEPGSVLRMILREGMLLVLAGIAIGVPSALWGASMIASRLSGVGSADSLTILSAALLMLLAAGLAAVIPARRASRVDPMVAIRVE